MKDKLKLNFVLFILGILGILTLLTIEFPAESFSKAALNKFSLQTLKYLTLINPIFLLLLAIFIGSKLSKPTGLTTPTISKLLKINIPTIHFNEQMKYGCILGILIGIFGMLSTFVFNSIIPLEFKQLENNLQVSILAKIGYGGITEELLTRYGFMTFAVWIVFKITNKLNHFSYWIGIIISSVLFALGHFPAVFASSSNASTILLTYVFISNFFSGITFGWLYWKKGLESSIIGHILAHLTRILLQFTSII